MSLNNLKERNCEANKKVSYRQRGSVCSKHYLGDVPVVLENEASGISLSVKTGDVIDSALFQRTVRDCRGNSMSKSLVRRFRKSGSDEWFSIPVEKSKDFWDNKLESLTDKKVDNDAEILDEPNSIDEQVTKKSDESSKVDKSFTRKNKNLAKIIAVAGVFFIGYKLFSK